MKGGTYEKLDSALFHWFRQQRENVIPVTGPIISLQKATEFHRLFMLTVLCSLMQVMVSNCAFVSALQSKTLPYQEKK